MTATNHALSGALIGALLPLPVAIPVAFMSHFVLDKIPHFGIDENNRNSSWANKLVVSVDVAIALSLGIVSAVLHKWSMLICGFTAFSPDLTLVLYWIRHGYALNIQPSNGFMKFHLAMQYERPWGIVPELVIAIGLLPFVVAQLIGK